MLKIVTAIFLVWLSVSPAFAAPASADSIETLLVLSKAQAGHESIMNRMEDGMRTGLERANANPGVTAVQKQALEQVPARVAAMMKNEMSWERYKPLVARVYFETYDQAEVDALIAFYKTKTGQMFATKFPLFMQKSSDLTLNFMQTIFPKMIEIQQELAAEAMRLR